VFVRPPNGWMNTTETAALTPSEFGGSLGASITTNGTTVVAGAPSFSKDGFAQGAAFVFVEPNGGWVNMQETAELVATLPGWSFGQSVAIDRTGHVIAVGAPSETATRMALAMCFCSWSLLVDGRQPSIQVSSVRLGCKHGDGFGGSISLTNSTLAVGGGSAVYVFKRK